MKERKRKKPSNSQKDWLLRKGSFLGVGLLSVWEEGEKGEIKLKRNFRKRGYNYIK